MTLTPFAGILSLSILTGGLQMEQAEQLPLDKRYGWTEERVVSGSTARQKSQQRTFVLRIELMPDSSPSPGSFTLYERSTPSGDLRRVAERVEGARQAPDGTLYFVQDSHLIKLEDGNQRQLLDKSTGDFDFAAATANIALVRLGKDGEPNAIALVSREGKVERQLAAESEGMLWLPLFTPDGKSLVYLSSETGFASFWRVNLDGTGRRQLTNLNIKSDTGGIFSQDFVPPAERRESMRFVTATRLEYEAGEAVWQLDVETGQAWRIRAGTSGQEGGDAP